MDEFVIIDDVNIDMKIDNTQIKSMKCIKLVFLLCIILQLQYFRKRLRSFKFKYLNPLGLTG